MRLEHLLTEAYTIHELYSNGTTGEMLSSAYTRYKLVDELQRLGIIRSQLEFKLKLPRFGKELLINGADGKKYSIKHV